METALTHEGCQGESQRKDEEEDEDPSTLDWYCHNADGVPDRLKNKVSVASAKRVPLGCTHITPKMKCTTARMRTRIMTEPRLGRTTPYPMQTMSSMKKLMLFRAAFSRATARTSGVGR